MEQNNDQGATPVFAIEKIYVKDLSAEVPNAPEIFLEATPPEVEVHLGNQGQAIGEGVFEVVLTVTVTAKAAEKVVFLVEVSQAGIFRIENIPGEQVEPLIGVACPNVLFPYAREVISSAISQAGFTPVVLQPVNFEAMYMASLEQRAQQSAGNEAPTLQ